MVRVQRAVLIALAVFCILSIGEVFGAQDPVKQSSDIVLTPADQLILDRIDNLARGLNARIDNLDQGLNARIDKVNDRIDNLWITMLGGFLGVMGFIGALVFWDRRTFMRRAREEMRLELREERKKMDGIIAALKQLGARFPEVGEVLRSFGLL